MTRWRLVSSVLWNILSTPDLLLSLTGLVWMRARILALEDNLSRMKDWMKSIYKNFSGMGVIFRDESHDGN